MNCKWALKQRVTGNEADKRLEVRGETKPNVLAKEQKNSGIRKGGMAW